jgi:tetratricopeptide (TPR) repeat protein
MQFTRRRFIKTAGLSGAFLTARYRGATAWAASSQSAAPCLFHAGPRYAPFIERFLSQIEPGNDDYITEKYAAEIEGCLNSWGASLRQSPRDLRLIEEVLTGSLLATPLNSVRTTTLRAGSPLESEEVSFAVAGKLEGSSFLDSARAYFAPFLNLKVAEFQVGGLEIISESPLQIRTQIQYDLSGSLGNDRGEERTGEWQIDWERNSAGKWSIIRWVAGRELRARLSGRGFVDITEACLGAVPSYQQQMRHGVDYWRTVLDGSSGIDIYGNNGIAVGDFDGDGWDDIYVCQPAGLPNRLYRNRGDGTFDDVTEKAGVGVLDGTSSAIFADLDNSGHQDLIVVRTNGPLLFINRGDGVFHLRPDAFQFARQPQGTFTAAAVADYDRDGLLDVYFCLYSFYQGLSEYQFPSPYYDAQDGPPNFLLKNRGNHTFEDVTVSSGMDRSNNRYSFACSWNDYNNDGWPDLYVVNDFGRKVLYKNNRDGTFADVSAASGAEDPGEGMSMAWLDYDNDGFDDLYVVNMWEAAGKRVTAQSQFLPTAPEEVKRVYRQDAMGNSLLHNEGGKGVFRDVSDDSGTRFGGWNWGCEAWDFDHDGYPDLYIANGFISGTEPDNLSSFFWRHVVSRSLASSADSQDYSNAWSAINEFVRSGHSWSGRQRNNFYLNNGNGTFTEAGGILGLDFLDDSRAFALVDLDHDGRLEIVLKNRTAPQLRVLRNELKLINSSICISLKGTKSNRDAIGAMVELETSAGRQRSTLRAGSGFLTQNSKVLTFGLKPYLGPIRATVHWPNGSTQSFENLPANHRVLIEEGVADFRSEQFHPAPQYAQVAEVKTEEPLPAALEAWLADPIRPPDFKLPDRRGEMRSLADGLGRPQILVLWRPGCSASDGQLEAMEKHWPEWKKQGLTVLALQFRASQEETDSDATSPAVSLSFPVVAADKTIAAVYDIFHRYLFERRCDITMPTTLLLDTDGAAVKIYSGAAVCAQIDGDIASIPAGAEARMKCALPFPGLYFGKGLHHNYFTYGVAYLQYGFEDQAISSFQLSIDRNPTYGPAYYNLGLIYLNKGIFDQARVNIEKAVLLDANNADAWNNLGVVYGQKEDYTKAEECFERTLHLQPAHLLAIQNLVKLYEFQRRPERARQILEKAIAVDPGSAELHVGLAMFYMGIEDLNPAKEEFESAVRLKPQNVAAINGLGVVLMRQGDTHAAMERFMQCTRLAPDFDRAYLNMAALYLNEGDAKKARDVLIEFLATHPDNSDVRDELKEVEQSK